MSEIHKKLYRAIHEMGNPIKDKSAYKYYYADLSQVLGIVKPVLDQNGLCLYQHVKYENGKPYLITTVFDEDESLDLSERQIHDFPDAQATGSYDTYMRRYELLKVFCLTADDDDGAATSGIVEKKPSALQLAQQRLLKAERRFCELNDLEPKNYHETVVMKRDDYSNDVETLNRIAAELEG